MSFYLNCASILIFLEEQACLNNTVQYKVVYYQRTDIICQVLKCSVWAKGYFPACADQVIQGSLTLT